MSMFGGYHAAQPKERRCIIVLDILACSYCDEKWKIKYLLVHIPHFMVSKRKLLAHTKRSMYSRLPVYFGKQAVSVVVVVVSAVVALLLLDVRPYQYT